MPIYEYRCKDCNHTFEVFQSFTDDALTECPTCGGTLRKVFGNVGITFKGSGFYKTDSRAGSGSGAGRKASAEDGTSTNGTSGDGASSQKSSSDGSSGKGSSGSSGSSSDSSSTPAQASST